MDKIDKTGRIIDTIFKMQKTFKYNMTTRIFTNIFNNTTYCILYLSSNTRNQVMLVWVNN